MTNTTTPVVLPGNTTLAVGAPPLPSIPGFTVRHAHDIFDNTTRLAWLLWAPSGYGKTTLAGQLDELTIATQGKRSVFIAVEPTEGGGAASIRSSGTPLIVPKDYSELDKVVRWLRNDKTIGGVVLDSATEAVKQHVKTAAMKYPSRENTATRMAGVMTRSDYQVTGELTSQLFRNLLLLTSLDDPNMRKHVIITAADSTREDQDSGRVEWIGPDLPGRMRTESVQMFQQVGTIGIAAKVVDGKRTNRRYISFTGDGVRQLKDRFNTFPGEIELTGRGDLLRLYNDYWLPGLGGTTPALTGTATH